jgi:hypothetical protein
MLEWSTLRLLLYHALKKSTSEKYSGKIPPKESKPFLSSLTKPEFGGKIVLTDAFWGISGRLFGNSVPDEREFAGD